MTQSTVSYNQVSIVLEDAAALCARGWCQDEDALSREFGGVAAHDPSACAWCAEGAMLRVSPTGLVYEAAREVVKRVIQSRSIVDWNDAPERTQAEVVAKLREAAQLARQGRG